LSVTPQSVTVRFLAGEMRYQKAAIPFQLEWRWLAGQGGIAVGESLLYQPICCISLISVIPVQSETGVSPSLLKFYMFQRRVPLSNHNVAGGRVDAGKHDSHHLMPSERTEPVRLQAVTDGRGRTKPSAESPLALPGRLCPTLRDGEALQPQWHLNWPLPAWFVGLGRSVSSRSAAFSSPLLCLCL